MRIAIIVAGAIGLLALVAAGVVYRQRSTPSPAPLRRSDACEQVAAEFCAWLRRCAPATDRDLCRRTTLAGCTRRSATEDVAGRDDFGECMRQLRDKPCEGYNPDACVRIMRGE